MDLHIHQAEGPRLETTPRLEHAAYRHRSVSRFNSIIRSLEREGIAKAPSPFRDLKGESNGIRSSASFNRAGETMLHCTSDSVTRSWYSHLSYLRMKITGKGRMVGL